MLECYKSRECAEMIVLAEGYKRNIRTNEFFGIPFTCEEDRKTVRKDNQGKHLMNELVIKRNKSLHDIRKLINHQSVCKFNQKKDCTHFQSTWHMVEMVLCIEIPLFRFPKI
jgi:hypothetical protein